MKDSAIIVSGGMDSITMLYEYKDIIGLAITFDKHYGKCGTCIERKEALHDAGIMDNIEYKL